MKISVQVNIPEDAVEAPSVARNLLEAVATAVYGGQREGKIKHAGGEVEFKVLD